MVGVPDGTTGQRVVQHGQNRLQQPVLAAVLAMRQLASLSCLAGNLLGLDSSPAMCSVTNDGVNVWRAFGNPYWQCADVFAAF